jgi:hypothetical protein
LSRYEQKKKVTTVFPTEPPIGTTLSTTTYPRPYHEFIKRQPASNHPKAFIKELDRLSPVKIPHNAAFRTYQSQKEFRELWNGELEVIEPALELAVRYLSNHDRRECAEGLVRAWWKKHNIESDEITLIFALNEAWRLTAEKRRRFYMTKEENRLIGKRPTTRQRVLDYLSARTGTAPQIADALHEGLKTIGMCLSRLTRDKLLERIGRGVYGLATVAETA